jgi:hypothetical protein
VNSDKEERRTASQNLNPLSTSCLAPLILVKAASTDFKASSLACFTVSESLFDSVIAFVSESTESGDWGVVSFVESR